MIAEKNNAICAICGKKYYMCRSCKDQIRLNPWKIHTDTSEHYKVFQIVHGHTIGVYSKAEAKEKFKTVDLSDLDTFTPTIKAAIESILAEPTAVESKNEIDEEVENEKASGKRRGRSKVMKTEQVETDVCE